MAMTMTGEVQLAAPRQTVWEKLNDPEVLKATIPGCESLEKTSDTSFAAVAVTKIGPVKAKWKGKVTLTDLRVGDASVDLLFHRWRGTTSAEVLRSGADPTTISSSPRETLSGASRTTWLSTSLPPRNRSESS